MIAQDVLRGIQDQLKEEGLYAGAIDGIPGPLIEGAWRQLCNQATGEELRARQSAGLPAPAVWTDHIVIDNASSSSWNPAALVARGVKLVFLRCAYGDTLDHTFPQRRKEAEAIGLIVAGYILPHPGDIAAQVNRVFEAYGTDFRLAVDWEEFAGERPSFSEIVIALQIVKARTGDAHPILYGAHTEFGEMTTEEQQDLAA